MGPPLAQEHWCSRSTESYNGQTLLVRKLDLKLENYKRGRLETFVVAIPPTATLYDKANP